MENIYYLLFVFGIFWYFITLRKVSEVAQRQIKKYCEQENIQVISIARKTSKLRFNKQFGPHFLSIFDVEFSGDGESSYQGVISFRGYKMELINFPTYRI